jgi:hypothetical protein
MKDKLNTVHTKVTPDLMASTSNGSVNLFCFQRSSHGVSSVTVKRKRNTFVKKRLTVKRGLHSEEPMANSLHRPETIEIRSHNRGKLKVTEKIKAEFRFDVISAKHSANLRSSQRSGHGASLHDHDKKALAPFRDTRNHNA